MQSNINPQITFMSPMKSRGFIKDEKGLCSGLTMAFTLFGLLGQFDEFNDLFNFVRSTPDLAKQMEVFQADFCKREGIKNDKELNNAYFEKYSTLNAREQKLVKIIALFNIIRLYQTPGKPLGNIDITDITKMLAAKAAQSEDGLLKFYFDPLHEKGGVENIFHDELMYTPSEWCGFLEELRIFFQELQKQAKESIVDHPIIIVINLIGNPECHRIAISYHYQQDKWIFFDSNVGHARILPDKDEKDSASSQLPQKALRNGYILDLPLLYVSQLKEEYKEFIPAVVQIFTTGKNPHLEKIRKSLATFKQKPHAYCPSDSAMLARKNIVGDGLFQFATLANDVPKFELFIKNKVDLDQMSSGHATAAINATFFNHFKLLELLAIAGADLNKPNADSYAPIHVAAQEGHLEGMKILLDPQFKVDINQVTNQGLTSISIAIAHNHVKIAELLAKRGADLNKTEVKDGIGSPLHLATQVNSIESMRLLTNVQFKDNINLNQTLGPMRSTVAHLAAERNHAAIMELLAEAGADLQKPNSKCAPIHIAAQKNAKEVMQVLLQPQYKVNIEQETKEKVTALWLAAQDNHMDIVEMLAKAGANLNHQGFKGMTPLMIAIQLGHRDIARYLLKQNVNPLLCDNNNHNAVYYALKQKDYELAAELLRYSNSLLTSIAKPEIKKLARKSTFFSPYQVTISKSPVELEKSFKTYQKY